MEATSRNRQDDPTIPDEEELYRRIVKDWIVPQPFGGNKLSSQAFRDEGQENEGQGKRREASVDLSSLAPAEETFNFQGRNERTVGVVSITAGEARNYEHAVVRDPLPDNPAHGLICGDISWSGTKYRKLAKNLAGLAKNRWVFPPGENPFE
jgi:hypothetical protein